MKKAIKKTAKKEVKKTLKKSYELGAKIKSVKELVKLAKEKKSVYCKKFANKKASASFVIHRHFIDVYNLIESGLLFKIK